MNKKDRNSNNLKDSFKHQKNSMNQSVNRQKFQDKNFNKLKSAYRLSKYKSRILSKLVSAIFKNYYPLNDFIRLIILNFMYIGKENLHPNVSHLIKQKKSIDQWSKSSMNHHNSKKYSDRQDWRKRIMYPSYDKLDKMLNSQKSLKECMRTTLSEQKMINSFVSSANYTLQKYFQSDKASKEKEQPCLKKQLMNILLLLQKVFHFNVEIFQSMSQEQLIQLIKNQLEGLVPYKKLE